MSTEQKTENGYWSPSMQTDHMLQMEAHVAKHGPLGVLRMAPTAKQYEQGRRALAAERKAQAEGASAPTAESKAKEGKA